ncbi:MAG: putative Ig domain-containing protein [Bryobacteraceae bacterium]
MRSSFLFVPVFSVFMIAAVPLRGQSLSVVSGNGQLVLDQFVTSAPLVVRAKDAAGRPAPGVSVTWSITLGSGTLVNAMTATDANGLASTNFLGSLNPGLSFAPATVTATSALGAASFFVTTSISRQPGGGLAAPPLVELVTPPLGNRMISGRAGSTLPGAVVVRVTVQSGAMSGQPVPNVGVQIVNASDPSLPSAVCNAPGGVVLTDLSGLATCDLVLGAQTGTVSLFANAGGLQNTPLFTLQVTPGAACTYSLSAAGQSFGATGGTGNVSVIAPAGCGWSASVNASWITNLSGVNGTGNGTVGYSVSANTGVARSGTLLIAGQTYTINQAAAGGTGPGPLMITTGSNLPAATVSIAYAATLAASGGTPPYTWAANGALPPGLSLTSTGVLTGVPSSVGNYTLAATVTDSAGQTQTQAFSLVVVSSSSVLTIANTGFPSGVAGQAYQQALTSSGGCVTPFSPVPTFSLAAGTLPAGLSVQQVGDRAFAIAGTPTAAGTSNFTLSTQDACGSRATANFALTILPAGGAAALVVKPGSLTFTVQVGFGTNPAPQTLSITSTGTAIPYTAAASTVNGGNWLVLDSTSGSTPGTLTVSVANYGTLPAGSYSGAITIISGASNSPVMVPVTLTILAPPMLIVSPAALTFTQPASGGTVSQQSIVVASGGAPAHFTATAGTVNGGPWLFVNTNAGDTPATLTALVNAAGLAPGTYTGSITVSVAGTGAQIIAVTLNVPASGALTVSPASLSFHSPSVLGAPPTQNVSVSSSAGATPFTAAGLVATGPNWLLVTPRSGTTPANVTVSTNAAGLPVGSYSGSVIITPADPSIAPVTVSVALTVGQVAPNIRATTNAASFAPGPISPGEIVAIFGAGLGPATSATAQLDPSGKVAATNSGTQVLFDGFAAPITYTSDNQVNVIVPYEIFGRAVVTLQASFNGALSNTLNLRVADSAPAIFTLTSDRQGAILNADGSINFPQTGADPGSYVSIFATGEGQTDPPGIDGNIITADALPRPGLRVSVQINGEPVEVQYAGGAPGAAAGLLQVNARVPADLAHGSRVTVVLTVGNQNSPAVFLSVK